MKIALPFILLSFLLFLNQCKTKQSHHSSRNSSSSPVGHSSEFPASTSATSPLVSNAISMVSQWQKERSVNVKTPLRILYWTPKGVAPLTGYKKRIRKSITEVQKYYANQMQQLGFGSMTFNLDLNEVGQSKIYLVKSKYADFHPRDYQKSVLVSQECHNELEKYGINESDGPTLIVVNTATWDAANKILKSPFYQVYVPGGTFYSSTSYCCDSPLNQLNPTAEIPDEFTFLNPSLQQQSSSVTISNETYQKELFYNLALQVGNLFSLCQRPKLAKNKAKTYPLMSITQDYHRSESSDFENGPMLSLQNGLILLTHPSFSGSRKSINTALQYKFNKLEFTNNTDNRLTVRGQIQASTPAYTLIAKAWPMDQHERHIQAGLASVDATGQFNFTFPLLKPNQTYRIRLSFLFANGWSENLQIDQTPYTFNTTTNDQGVVNIKQLQDLAALTPLGVKVSESDFSGVQHELEKIIKKELDPSIKAIAKTLANSLLKQTNPILPTNVKSETTSISLSALKADRFKVGWANVYVDQLPPPNALINKSGIVYQHCLVAHADSTGTYSLNKQWKRFTGKVSILNGRRGRANFLIIGDGNVLWQANNVHEHILPAFDIDISHVDKLQIIAKAHNGNKTAAWSLWLDPTLTR